MPRIKRKLPENLSCDLSSWRSDETLAVEMEALFWIVHAAFPWCKFELDCSIAFRRIRVELLEGTFDCSKVTAVIPDGDLWLYLDELNELIDLAQFGDFGTHVAALAGLVMRYVHGSESVIRARIDQHNHSIGEPDLSSDVSLVIGLSRYRRTSGRGNRTENLGEVVLSTEDLVELYRVAFHATTLRLLAERRNTSALA